MAQWSLDLREYAKKKGVQIKDVQKSFAFAVYASVVKKTPVGNPDFDADSGRARANWNVSVGKPDTSVSDGKRKGPLPKSAMPEPDGDESIFICNNLPYITMLEYGGYPKSPKKGSHTRKGVKPSRYEILSQGGFSKQAPQGMVGVTIANSERLFDAAVRATERGV